MVKFVAQLKVISDPFEASTYQGPVISKTQYDRVMNYIECGKQDGASIITGGKRHGKEGYFIEPVRHVS